jgi:predicted TIM-barrel fold metal-dependent hydrolase
LHIDKVVVSKPTSEHTSPEKITALNNAVAEALKRHPGFLYGFCFADPHHGGQAIAEIERCVRQLGFIGVKLYTQRTLDDPLQYPIIEKCIELDIPILMHALKFGPRYPGPESIASHGVHFKNAARRYPEAIFIHAHLPCGDWHWQLKGLAGYKNIFADISGSPYDLGVVEAMVKVLGADKILFATDGSFSAGIGKLLGAELSEKDKLTILNAPRFAKYIDGRVN